MNGAGTVSLFRENVVRSCVEPYRGSISGGKSMSAEFRQRHMRVIGLNENDVASQIRMNHGRELEVVDAALDQILQGLDAFAYVKQRPDSRLERCPNVPCREKFQFTAHCQTVIGTRLQPAGVGTDTHGHGGPACCRRRRKPILQRWTRYSTIKDLSAVET